MTKVIVKAVDGEIVFPAKADKECVVREGRIVLQAGKPVFQPNGGFDTVPEPKKKPTKRKQPAKKAQDKE